MSNEQSFRHTMARTSCISLILCLICSTPTRLAECFLVLAHWKKVRW